MHINIEYFYGLSVMRDLTTKSIKGEKYKNSALFQKP